MEEKHIVYDDRRAATKSARFRRQRGGQFWQIDKLKTIAIIAAIIGNIQVVIAAAGGRFLGQSLSQGINVYVLNGEYNLAVTFEQHAAMGILTCMIKHVQRMIHHAHCLNVGDQLLVIAEHKTNPACAFRSAVHGCFIGLGLGLGLGTFFVSKGDISAVTDATILHVNINQPVIDRPVLVELGAALSG